MKTLKYIIFSFVAMAAAITMDAAERSVSFPSCSILVKDGENAAKKNDAEFRIVDVSVSSEKTAVSCEVVIRKKVKRFFFIGENCALFYQSADGMVRSTLTSADGIPVLSEREASSQDKKNYKKGDKIDFVLYFDPLPEEVSSFDLIEDMFSTWNIVDVSLADGAPSWEEQKIGTCPYDDVIKKPTFLGQEMNSFSHWVTSRLIYPEKLRRTGQEGEVVFEIIIDILGVAHYQIIEPSLTEFNAEATRIVKSAPKWAPGTIRGMPVECSLRFPVYFMLQ